MGRASLHPNGDAHESPGEFSIIRICNQSLGSPLPVSVPPLPLYATMHKRDQCRVCTEFCALECGQTRWPGHPSLPFFPSLVCFTIPALSSCDSHLSDRTIACISMCNARCRAHAL